MKKARHEVGYINGINYTLVFDKLGNQQACDSEYHNQWRWFLKVNGDYLGDYKTKAEAIAAVHQSFGIPLNSMFRMNYPQLYMNVHTGSTGTRDEMRDATMIYNTFDAILNGYETESENDTIDYARGMVWGECEVIPQSIGYANHIDTVDGVGVYYDFGADYYFFTDETI